MSSLAVRTRVAPIALVIVFGFVVVGFLRADREMVRSEEARAALLASETAALIEVFLLRHAERLRATERLIADQWTNRPWLADSVRSILNRVSGVSTQFDALWLLDSAGTVHATVALRTGGILPSVDARIGEALPNTAVASRLATLSRAPLDEARILAYPGPGSAALLFVHPIDGRRGAHIVGVVSSDSLAALLHRQQYARSFGIVVQSRGDTLLRVGTPSSSRRFRSVRDDVMTPAGETWTVAMIYAPSGRGVRITMWVVGLGAVVGLGIGLFLERREVSRIADRSSELEHLSAELLRANRAKSEFLANVSHELRTPLNAIVGFVDLLRDGVYGALNPRQVGPVERIEASATHLRHLVDQVLDLAKMAAGRLEVHTEPLELRPFVFDVASEVEPLISEKGLSFSLAVGASLPRIRTDPTHLRQILINLLGNAVKFTSNGGITVRGKLVATEARSGLPSVLSAATALVARSPRPDIPWVALQVADSGVGIPDKDRDRIFDEFEQVNAGPRGDSIRRGTGLGLSISRRLARLLGGDITVESEPGRGSVFTVWLPVDPADVRGNRGP
jgi:two-component system sensor histidine kinase EvgS